MFGQSACHNCNRSEVRDAPIIPAICDKLIFTRLRRLPDDGTDTVVKDFLAEFGTMKTGKVCNIAPDGALCSGAYGSA